MYDYGTDTSSDSGGDDYQAPSAGQVAGAAQFGIQAGMQTGSKAVGGITAGLATAALFDPEPISKAILSIAAGFVATFSKIFSGCGATCVEATKFADTAEQAASSIKEQYFAQPIRTKSLQAAALQAMDQVLNYLYQGCSNPALGDAGKRCISERLTRGCGGCAPGSNVPQWSWCPDGMCDMWTTFRDPIANDPSVVPDPSPVSAVTGSIQQAFAGLPASVSGLFQGYGLVLFTIAAVAAFVLYRMRTA